MKRLVFSTLLVLLAGLLIGAGVVFASGNETGPNVCPSGGDWTKVDGLSGTTYTFTPPAGFAVTDNCYKHSTYRHFGSGPTVTADIHCGSYHYHFPSTWHRHCNQYALSHASFKLIETYKTCDQTTEWVLVGTSEETKPNGVVVKKYSYEKYDARDQETVCDTMVAVERIPYEACSTVTDWVAQTPTQRQLPNGDIITSTVFLKFDAVDQETVCARRVLLDRDEYGECTEFTVGEWSDFAGSGINKTSYRESIDDFTGEVCNTEYRKKCFGEESVHFWTDGWCKFRDRTYPDNASWMVNPPVFAQNAYCGCGYVPFGEWGIVEVSECDEGGYKYWNELPPSCGFENCE